METLSTDYMATWKYQQSQKNDKKGIELKVMDGVNMIYHQWCNLWRHTIMLARKVVQNLDHKISIEKMMFNKHEALISFV